MKSTGESITLLSASDRKLCGRLYGLQDLFRTHLHENVEIQTIMFLLEVSSHEEPIDLTSLGTKLGLSKAAASRNYYRLADGKGGEGGLDLVKSQVDYNDRRRLLILLTPKGIKTIESITAYVGKWFKT
jgi:DNA-binding MarR family transcriptional regulator